MVSVYIFAPNLIVIDGYVARELNQLSALGAWLDVLVDNIARGMVWSRILPWGYFVSALEWTVFVCTHSSGPKWRQAFGHAPWWVQSVMANGFKTPQGTLVTLGLHVLPLWIYGWQRIEAPIWFAVFGFVVLLAGRLMAFAVELWCIKIHVQSLVAEK